MQASSRRRKLSTCLLISACGNSAHACKTARLSSAVDLACFSETRRCSEAQTVSIGFKSGEYGGQTGKLWP
jgi:hypothetical protein